MRTWWVCIDSASAVELHPCASARSTSDISACDAPPPPSSAGTPAENSRRSRSSAKLSATKLSSVSWAAARAAKRGASSRAMPAQSVRTGSAVGAVEAIVMMVPPAIAGPRLSGANHRASPMPCKDQKMDLPHFPLVPTVRGMKGYGQFCTVAVASEIFAERWTPLILRELFGGSHRFNDIRHGVPLISRTLLAQRLRELEAAGVVESRPLPARGREYQLTRAGNELRAVVDGLG